MYHTEQSLGRIWQLRYVDKTPIAWRVCYIGAYIASGPYGYGKFDLMHFHYHYPRYYIPLERNQDKGIVGGKTLPLEPMVGIPMEPILGLPLKLTVVLPQEQA